MSEIQNAVAGDGFDDASGDSGQTRVIIGTKLSFANEGVWVDGEELEFSPTRELVVTDLARVLQKWINQRPVETRFLQPGEHPDVEVLNEDAPPEEWGTDLNDKPRGPWQLHALVYMVDVTTMERFTYPTGTVGGNIAISDLKEAVRLMRRFRGANTFPIVCLGSKLMKTRFGGRQRPHFIVKRWFAFGEGGAPALPPAATQHSALPSPGISAAAPLSSRSVAEPTLQEEMDDDIPF